MKNFISKINAVISILSVLTMLFIGIEFIRIINMPTGKTQQLDFKNVLVMDIEIDKWYSEKEITIGNKNDIDEILGYINSFELIEVPKDYEDNNGHCYRLRLPYHDLTITGEYITIHKIHDDDKVFEQYFIKDSGYNFVTGSNKISRFIDDFY